MGWNQQELANKVKISRDYVSQIENGREPGARLRADLEKLMASMSADPGSGRGSECGSGSSESEGLQWIADESGNYSVPERWPIELRLGVEDWRTLETCAEATGMDPESLLRTLLRALGRSLEGGVPGMPWVVQKGDEPKPEGSEE